MYTHTRTHSLTHTHALTHTRVAPEVPEERGLASQCVRETVDLGLVESAHRYTHTHTQ